ncbi:tripartite tricarboxylate transporter substrate binding protein [Microbacterium sp. gxy059]|uniref:tripartite tricarboxylate transporter substrate binding protein n=1 Tax=Microbacterium sp. gxy059 TaxID=2957199 RepID=UPI003D9762D2
MPRNRLTRSLAGTGAALLSVAALAACSDGGSGGDAGDDYPSEDITLIVQAAAGGGSDLTSRALAAELEPLLDTSIVVENRPGASGSTAMQYVRDEEPDGYTIGFVPVEIAMLGHQGFDVLPEDYDFIGQIMLAPGALVVPNDSPYETFEDFIEGAKETPLAVGNSGAGSIWEAAAFGVADATGAQLESVPFDGGAPAVTAVIGGQIDAAVGGVGEVSAAADDGQLRPLAIFHDERHPDLPDVPTAAEAGYDDLEFGGWGGIYAPKDLPDDVRATLEEAVEAAATSDGFVETLAASGPLPVYRDSAEFQEFVLSEYERFGEILGSR